MSKKNKGQKNKWYRVAVSGQTIDGRVITKQEIKDMAETYDPAIYTAKIWPEHFKWSTVGDVTAARYEEYELNGEKELALYVQYESNPNYDFYKRYGEKAHGSVEIFNNMPRFEGRSYLIGLGVTDRPASFGTEKLYAIQEFNTKFNESEKESFITPFVEMSVLELADDDEPKTEASLRPSFFASLFGQKPEQEPAEHDQKEYNVMAVSDVELLLSKFAEGFSHDYSEVQKTVAEQTQTIGTLQAELAKVYSLIESLSTQPVIEEEHFNVAGNDDAHDENDRVRT